MMTVLNRILAVALLAGASSLYGQEFRSALSGLVTDSQGAVVPGVKIAAIETRMGSRSETLTAADGAYTIPFLPPGLYRIEAQSTAGFKRYERDGFRIGTNERLRLDIALELGQVSETVTVTAEAPMLRSATGSSGQIIGQQEVENAPLNGRTPLTLAQLAYGVIPATDPQHYRPFDTGAQQISMGGAPSRSNELLVDGAPNNKGDGYSPPMDAVQEVSVESFQSDAAYGHTGGGTVNIVLKSGTNKLHGSAYEFNQPAEMAANTFFSNRSGGVASMPVYDQFGASLAGPVILPKVFNGRNKVFFFFVFEGLNNDRPGTSTTTVPTEAQRNGDFSALLRIGSNYQIYDPSTGVREGTRIRRQPFAGNQIPVSRFSPVAKNLLPFYPAPNQPGRNDGGNNFYTPTNEANAFDNEIGRLDFNLGSHNKLFFNFRHSERKLDSGKALGPDNIARGDRSWRSNWGSMFDYVRTLSPTAVLDTRLSWARYTSPTNERSDGYDLTKLGFPAWLQAAAARRLIPEITVDSFAQLGGRRGTNGGPQGFQIFSTLTRVAGRHSLKFGADLRLDRTDARDATYGAGAYRFSTNWTRGPLDNAASAPLGQDMAALLLGLPTSGYINSQSDTNLQSGYYAVFVQDDFRLRPNLTLNLGLRHERDVALTERYNRLVAGFDFTTPNPISAAAAAAYAKAPIPEIPLSQFRTPGGLVYVTPQSRSPYSTGARYISPRFGFAWSPGKLGRKTVIRGGLGTFLFPVGTGSYQTGFTVQTPLVPTLDNYLTPAATLADPFPNGLLKPSGSGLGLATNLGQAVAFYGQSPLNAYSIRWTFNVQRELSNNLLMELGYMGNHAVHLDIARQLNYVPATYLSRTGSRDQPVIDSMTAIVANPFAGLLPGTNLNSATVSRSSLLVARPQFLGLTRTGNNPEGSSYFHMLQSRLEKRFSHGLRLLAGYTYSKLLERRSRLNDADPWLEKRVADEDRPKRLVLSGGYELPVGRGKRFAHGANRWVNGAIGGWALNLIYMRQSGQPLSWGNVIYQGGDLGLDPRSIDNAFDTSRFNRDSRQQLDWNLRTFPTRFANLRGDGPNHLDVSMHKNFRIREVLNVQFRGEFFNAVNHPVFSNPNLSPTSSSFSQITGQSNLPRRVQLGLRASW